MVFWKRANQEPKAVTTAQLLTDGDVGVGAGPHRVAGVALVDRQGEAPVPLLRDLQRDRQVGARDLPANDRLEPVDGEGVAGKLRIGRIGGEVAYRRAVAPGQSACRIGNSTTVGCAAYVPHVAITGDDVVHTCDFGLPVHVVTGSARACTHDAPVSVVDS